MAGAVRVRVASWGAKIRRQDVAADAVIVMVAADGASTMMLCAPVRLESRQVGKCGMMCLCAHVP